MGCALGELSVATTTIMVEKEKKENTNNQD